MWNHDGRQLSELLTLSVIHCPSVATVSCSYFCSVFVPVLIPVLAWSCWSVVLLPVASRWVKAAADSEASRWESEVVVSRLVRWIEARNCVFCVRFLSGDASLRRVVSGWYMGIHPDVVVRITMSFAELSVVIVRCEWHFLQCAFLHCQTVPDSPIHSVIITCVRYLKSLGQKARDFLFNFRVFFPILVSLDQIHPNRNIMLNDLDHRRKIQ